MDRWRGTLRIDTTHEVPATQQMPAPLPYPSHQCHLILFRVLQPKHPEWDTDPHQEEQHEVGGGDEP